MKKNLQKLTGLLLTLVIHVFGGTILALLPISRVKLIRILGRIIDFRFWLLLMVQTLVFMLLFAFLPNGRNKLRDTVPGAILASLGWLVISWAFSLYVEHFPAYGRIYGSVYAVALMMLWLYLLKPDSQRRCFQKKQQFRSEAEKV